MASSRHLTPSDPENDLPEEAIAEKHRMSRRRSEAPRSSCLTDADNQPRDEKCSPKANIRRRRSLPALLLGEVVDNERDWLTSEAREGHSTEVSAYKCVVIEPNPIFGRPDPQPSPSIMDTSTPLAQPGPVEICHSELPGPSSLTRPPRFSRRQDTPFPHNHDDMAESKQLTELYDPSPPRGFKVLCRVLTPNEDRRPRTFFGGDGFSYDEARPARLVSRRRKVGCDGEVGELDMQGSARKRISNECLP